MARHKMAPIQRPAETVAKAQRLLASNRNWTYAAGQQVKVRNGLPVPMGTVVTIKTLVPGLNEPGYIVTTGYDGDYWARESEIEAV